MADNPIVFIVDDDSAFRESLCALVSSMGLQAKAFASPTEYLEQFQPESPGVLLLDVRMPQMSGLTLQEKLTALPICPAIVVLTGHAEVPTALRAMKQGAVDFLQKTFTESELYEAIQRALLRDSETRAAHREKQDLENRFGQLNEPEKQVLSYVLEGTPNKQIASALGISRRTVEDRRARLMQKLSVDSLADLVRLAILAGFHRE